MAFGATYDACVLYPASLRDFLVRLGGRRVFHARWTDQILDEMTRAVLPNRADLTAEQLQRTRTLMCEAVPGCLTTGYEGLIEGLELPGIRAESEQQAGARDPKLPRCVRS